MTFHIISKVTNNPVNLNYFDALYCKYAGIEVKKDTFALWYPLLEGVFLMFSDLADNAKDSYFCQSRLCVKDPRKVSLHQAAQLILVNWSMCLWSGEKFEDTHFQKIKDIVNFYQENDDKFYFTFSL